MHHVATNRHNPEPSKGICIQNQIDSLLDDEIKTQEMQTTHKRATDFQRRVEMEWHPQYA